jgi:hypothetical protein
MTLVSVTGLARIFFLKPVVGSAACYLVYWVWVSEESLYSIDSLSTAVLSQKNLIKKTDNQCAPANAYEK